MRGLLSLYKIMWRNYKLLLLCAWYNKNINTGHTNTVINKIENLFKKRDKSSSQCVNSVKRFCRFFSHWHEGIFCFLGFFFQYSSYTQWNARTFFCKHDPLTCFRQVQVPLHYFLEPAAVQGMGGKIPPTPHWWIQLVVELERLSSVPPLSTVSSRGLQTMLRHEERLGSGDRGFWSLRSPSLRMVSEFFFL